MTKHPVESGDVVDLIQDRQGQDLADTGHGAEQVKRLAVVLLRRPDQRELEVRDERVVLLE